MQVINITTTTTVRFRRHSPPLASVRTAVNASSLLKSGRRLGAGGAGVRVERRSRFCQYSTLVCQ
jgi:hypothetical protein